MIIIDLTTWIKSLIQTLTFVHRSSSNCIVYVVSYNGSLQIYKFRYRLDPLKFVMGMARKPLIGCTQEISHLQSYVAQLVAMGVSIIEEIVETFGYSYSLVLATTNLYTLENVLNIVAIP